MAGHHGHYWRFDLSLGRGEMRRVPQVVTRAYVGGVGLGIWLLHREAGWQHDPLSDAAPLVIAFGPLAGTPLTTSAKFVIVARSPLTGMACDALSSSHFAIAGKRLGVDAIVLVGRCPRPSTLRARARGRAGNIDAELVDPGVVDPRQTAVLSVGVAGEQRVRFANVRSDGRHAGRGGLGAVLGAKQLTGLAVEGHHETPLHDPARVDALADRLRLRTRGEATARYREIGTTGNVAAFARIGALPTFDFRGDALPGVEALSGEQLHETRRGERRACAQCSIGCEHRFAPRGAAPVRVEYESLFALGPLCGITDPDAVLRAAQRCDQLGLDTISCGATVAFAMECGERGLLRGVPSFDDAAGLLALIDEIAHRCGTGALLADGSRALARRLGPEALDFAPQVKGLELPGYEPRALQTMALGFAVGTRGADHNRSAAYELDFSERVDRLHGDARAARLALETEDRAALLDSLVLCKFVRRALRDPWADAAEMLCAVCGGDWHADVLRAAARRTVDARKAFNIRAGWTPADDTLPARMLREPLPAGPVAGARLSAERLQTMVRSYNLARGWSARGQLGPAKWKELLLDD